ncbi:hypothetical protein A3B87_01390 [Candidatus Kuenenbacteria bacterium RIFCSPHIGHO2_02_FULL_39_13]|uniref:Uncharacterized protein n=1 Tax=Candidatus Kuenenbacteria bacterium RIFCSPHIGHO2_02_FULL_39_13 TaxID=1798561 RepID=A0A1F6FND0_9BACT|nr:MAG: hypothetical protein A3B87_01390 [Candidatus Kuenenbacteria bacterium RIFCSPHIGHO2_02_FULL_39_13]
MSAKTLLKQKGIDPNKPVLQISREEALAGIMEAIKEYCPNVKIEKMPKKDLEGLIDSLGEKIINYHPENYHQERSALLSYIKELKRCGLTNKEEDAIDFC